MTTPESPRSAVEPADSYDGLIAVARNAKEQGYPIHVATRTTCAEHIEQGDDERTDFAFGQAVEPADEALRLLRETLDWWDGGEGDGPAVLSAVRAYLAAQDVSRNLGANADEPTAEDSP